MELTDLAEKSYKEAVSTFEQRFYIEYFKYKIMTTVIGTRTWHYLPNTCLKLEQSIRWNVSAVKSET